VNRWVAAHHSALGAIATHWLTVIRECGADVRELVHDGRPTACVNGAVFAYVDAFRTHVNVGFYLGTRLTDPARLLQGTGRLMRHVKLTAADTVDDAAVAALIYAAYADIKRAVEAEADVGT
jgi:hypothetical protein